MKKVISIILVCLMLASTLCACSPLDNILGVKRIVFSEQNIEMTVGDSKALGIAAEPSSAQLKKLTWSSSDSNIAKVEDGTVTAVAKGSAVISVKAENGVTASCNVTVKDKEITALEMNKTSAKVKKGSTIQLKVDVTPVDAPTGDLKWSSSNDSVATVNSKGYVTGVSAGVVNITCSSSNGVETSCTITVSAPETKNNITNSNNTANASNNVGGYFNPNYTYTASDFVFPESSVRQLSTSEISSKLATMGGYSPSGSYAQDAINEIYARNGYVFKNAEIRAYYESKPWYYPNSGFTTSNFNSIEKYNLKLLEKY